MLAYGKQSICQTDIDAVIEVLTGDFLTQGPKVPEFEDALKRVTGAEHTIATNSATSALHLACRALGVGPGDLVWTSPITFVASANCVLYTGADIDFVDIDPVTLNMCPAALHSKLAQAKESGRIPKAVIPVHMAGYPCDMQSIHDLAKEYGFAIIEDASHALGAMDNGMNVGGCEYSDIAVFSFHPVKMITTGEGGAACTNNSELAETMRRQRSHGVTRDPQLMSCMTQAPWRYEQLELGYNYRMTDIEAALGVSQVAKLPIFLHARDRVAKFYQSSLTSTPLLLPSKRCFGRSSWHLYIVQMSEATEEQRLSLYEFMRERNVLLNVHYEPVHLQPFYQAKGFKSGDFPNAEIYASRCFSLPIHPRLSDEEMNLVVCSLKEFFK